jgi:hypothetical protein
MKEYELFSRSFYSTLAVTWRGLKDQLRISKFTSFVARS